MTNVAKGLNVPRQQPFYRLRASRSNRLGLDAKVSTAVVLAVRTMGTAFSLPCRWTNENFLDFRFEVFPFFCLL